MTSRWMLIKRRQRRAYLKKRPAGKFNPYLFKDTHGNPKDVAIVEGHLEPDWLDNLEPDYKKQRAWIDEQRRKQKQEQLQKPRPGIPQNVWYKISLVDWPNLQQEIWFSGNRFRYREIRNGVEKNSTIYPSKESLMSDFKDGLIIWDINPDEDFIRRREDEEASNA